MYGSSSNIGFQIPECFSGGQEARNSQRQDAIGLQMQIGGINNSLGQGFGQDTLFNKLLSRRNNDSNERFHEVCKRTIGLLSTRIKQTV